MAKTVAGGAAAHTPMAGRAFDLVRRLGLGLPGAEEGTAYGSPCLRAGKRLIACIAINKAAEPDSLMLRLTFDLRDELIAADPNVYYLKPHYEPYPCVLVRLSRVHPDALHDLLQTAWRLATAATSRTPARAPRPKRRARPSPRRRRSS